MSFADRVRQTLVGEVRALFHDPAKQEAPIERSADPMIAADSVAWRVHGDVATMMVGGIAALLLQMLHPPPAPACGTTATSAAT